MFPLPSRPQSNNKHSGAKMRWFVKEIDKILFWPDRLHSSWQALEWAIYAPKARRPMGIGVPHPKVAHRKRGKACAVGNILKNWKMIWRESVFPFSLSINRIALFGIHLYGILVTFVLHCRGPCDEKVILYELPMLQSFLLPKIIFLKNIPADHPNRSSIFPEAIRWHHWPSLAGNPCSNLAKLPFNACLIEK